MKQSVALSQFLGFGVTALLGTLLHFLYEWWGNAFWIAPFSGVNESTWEHMKLLFWPMVLFAAVQSIFFKDRTDFWCVKLRGVLLGLALIPIIFYTYNGVIGKSPDWVNISIFFIAAAVAYVLEASLLSRADTECKSPWLSIAALLALAVAFTVFTFRTPHLGIFADPLSGAYGI